MIDFIEPDWTIYSITDTKMVNVKLKLPHILQIKTNWSYIKWYVIKILCLIRELMNFKLHKFDASVSKCQTINL